LGSGSNIAFAARAWAAWVLRENGMVLAMSGT
jgi:hypothetical protein